jgi:hypothetical protein
MSNSKYALEANSNATFTQNVGADDSITTSKLLLKDSWQVRWALK